MLPILLFCCGAALTMIYGPLYLKEGGADYNDGMVIFDTGIVLIVATLCGYVGTLV